MNYLAHLFLAGESPELIVGNFLGDFVKGPLTAEFSKDITSGIWLHRKIDSYSDSHPVTLRSRNLFNKPARRFAGIIVDVSYDHFLSRHWDKFSEKNRRRFIDTRYQLLMSYWDILPDHLRRILPRLINQDWLGSYHQLEGIEAALNGISFRVKNGSPIAGSMIEVKSNYQKLESDFLSFFPTLISYVKSINGEMNTEISRVMSINDHCRIKANQN